MSAKEQAAISTLQVVAAASAPIAPWGTAASVAISAGIGIYQAVDAADRAKAEITSQILEDLSKINDFKVQKGVIEKALKRPTIPLDIYSGPPMYWIVDSSPLDNDSEFYKLPNSDSGVDWPCGSSGGKSIKKSADPQNIKISDIYAPTPPKNPPSMCVFFWAVPIFFARIMQLLGESMYGKAYDPKSRDGSRTKEDVLNEEVKKIILSGRLDEAGNWFGKIGPVIPPLAVSDDEFAPRFYGREGWVQSLTLDNIRFSNGTRYASTGLEKSPYIQYLKNKNNFDLSSELSRINRRVVLTINPKSVPVKISGILLPSNGIAKIMPQSMLSRDSISNPTMESGWVLTAEMLLSNYWVDDPEFRKMLSSENPDPSAFYYVTMMEILPDSKYTLDVNAYKSFDYYVGTYLGNDKGLTPSGIMKTIQLSGGFQRAWCASTKLKNQFNSDLSSSKITEEFFRSQTDAKFNLAPFDLSTVMRKQEVKKEDGKPMFAPRPLPNTEGDSYVFKDIGTEVSESTVGIYDGGSDYKNRYGWITEIAIMPGYDTSDGSTGWKAVEKSKKFNAYGISPHTDDMAEKEKSAKIYTMLPSLVAKSNAKSPKNIDEATPEIYEIIRTRPPNGTETTVLLPARYASGPKWANELIKSGHKEVLFAVRKSSRPQSRSGSKFKLGIFRIEKFTHATDINEKPIAYPQLSKNSSAMARFDHGENKPVISANGKESISPFYCGRRADERSKPAWKVVRDRTSNFGMPTQSVSTDTGWEDCHDWSWPYPTKTLKGIGAISKKIFDSLGEGIGRAGCSPSSIATGPTFWGDMNLYGISYQSLKEGLSTDPNSIGWRNNVAVCIWDAISEMQVGAYVRYPSRPMNISQTLAQAVQDRFSVFSNNNSARESYLKTAQEALKNGNPPKVWDDVKSEWVILTPDQAADLCMDVVDKWFNGVFPRPSPEYMDKFKKPNWDLSTVEEMARAQIMLKNWAIDLGRQESNRVGHLFPEKYFSINIFGLDKANRSAIASFNAVEEGRLAEENPIASANQMIGNSQPSFIQQKVETNGSFPLKTAIGLSVAAAAAAIIIARKK